MASFGAAISEHPDAAFAVGEVVGAVVEAVGEAPDVAFVHCCDPACSPVAPQSA